MFELKWLPAKMESLYLLIGLLGMNIQLPKEVWKENIEADDKGEKKINKDIGADDEGEWRK